MVKGGSRLLLLTVPSWSHENEIYHLRRVVHIMANGSQLLCSLVYIGFRIVKVIVQFIIIRNSRKFDESRGKRINNKPQNAVNPLV